MYLVKVAVRAQGRPFVAAGFPSDYRGKLAAFAVVRFLYFAVNDAVLGTAWVALVELAVVMVERVGVVSPVCHMLADERSQVEFWFVEGRHVLGAVFFPLDSSLGVVAVDYYRPGVVPDYVSSIEVGGCYSFSVAELHELEWALGELVVDLFEEGLSEEEHYYMKYSKVYYFFEVDFFVH